MQAIMDQTTQQKLLDFRGGLVDLGSLHKWADENQEKLRTHMSPGLLLKLRKGNATQVMGIVASIVPACQVCSGINPVGVFSSRQDHARCAQHVDAAMTSGALKRIRIPSWFQAAHSQLGADAYFECTCCGSIWTLVEPERQDHGLWERLA